MNRILGLVVSTGIALATTAGNARDLDQISWYVGYTAGGSYDAYARVITKHLSKYLPGSPTVLVKYMPGAGSRTLANYLAVAG
jgi:tripartite-type tricarboxylate transporter receptor subunit TctC